MNSQESKQYQKKLHFKNHIKQSDLYEGFEYHYQLYDEKGKNLNHDFDLWKILLWFKARGHDTLPWYQGGDINLTSVKSIDLTQSQNLIDLTSLIALRQSFNLLYKIFYTEEQELKLNATNISNLVKAFSPALKLLKEENNEEINKIIDNLINSLTGK